MKWRDREGKEGDSRLVAPPLQDRMATPVALEAGVEFPKSHPDALKGVRFVLYTRPAFRTHERGSFVRSENGIITP